MRVSSQSAYVLHHRDYSESSLVLEAFAIHHGRIGLLAKGARRPKSPWRGLLEPFRPLLLSWTGRGELAILTGAELERDASIVEGRQVFSGFYLNELLMRLLHRHDPHENLFAAYRRALFALSQGADDETVLRVFERDLLRELGYGLVLDREVSTESPLEAEAVYDYLPEHGPRRLAQPDAACEGVRISGASLLALAHDSLDGVDTRREVKTLMRATLARHLGDRPLNSRRLYQSIVAARLRNNERDSRS